ncbi:MAG: hypothetical protein AAGI88_22505, partial [Pseudomonadota bacterium]
RLRSVTRALKLNIGVTGHRDLVPSEIPGIRDEVRGFFAELTQQYSDLTLELISGLAEGADSVVAEVALDMGMPVVAVLPMEQSEYEQDFKDADSLSNFRDLLSRCQVVTLSPDTAVENTEELSPREIRSLLYAQLGVFLSNHCQILLTLWDGKQTEEVGGTHSVTHYHLTGVMPGFESLVESPSLLADNENDLAYHIVCSRQGEHGQPDDRYSPLESFWVTAHFGRLQDRRMPEDYQQMFERLALFSADCRSYAVPLMEQSTSLVEVPPGVQIPDECRVIDELYQSADWLAVRYQRLFSRSLLLSHLLAVCMGFIFIIYSELLEYSGLAWLFLGLFATGIGFHYLSERRGWHRKYLDYRALAEGLRVQVYWSLAGVVDGHAAEFAYDNFLQKQDVDLSWIRHVMRSASLQSFRNTRPDPRWVDWVSEHWVGFSDNTDGQLGYYESKARQRSAAYRRNDSLGKGVLWIGVSMAAFLGFFATSMSEDQTFVLVILMGVLPLIAGVSDTYSHKKADKELIKQYQFMARIFANARRLLNGTEDVEFKRRILRAVGKAALEEHAEWLLMQRERPLEHGGIQ